MRILLVLLLLSGCGYPSIEIRHEFDRDKSSESRGGDLLYIYNYCIEHSDKCEGYYDPIDWSVSVDWSVNPWEED